MVVSVLIMLVSPLSGRHCGSGARSAYLCNARNPDGELLVKARSHKAMQRILIRRDSKDSNDEWGLPRVDCLS